MRRARTRVAGRAHCHWCALLSRSAPLALKLCASKAVQERVYGVQPQTLMCACDVQTNQGNAVHAVCINQQSQITNQWGCRGAPRPAQPRRAGRLRAARWPRRGRANNKSRFKSWPDGDEKTLGHKPPCSGGAVCGEQFWVRRRGGAWFSEEGQQGKEAGAPVAACEEACEPALHCKKFSEHPLGLGLGFVNADGRPQLGGWHWACSGPRRGMGLPPTAWRGELHRGGPDK
jgi:hypothetical protein